MTTRYLTIKEVARLLGLSESTTRIHLSCMEKYKQPRVKPIVYMYNKAFLNDLRIFYVTKSCSIDKRYHKYIKTVKRIDSLMGLLQ